MNTSFKKQHMGPLDRILRVCVGITLIMLGGFAAEGVTEIILMILSAPFLISGIRGYCSLYILFGISTMPAIDHAMKHVNNQSRLTQQGADTEPEGRKIS